MSILITVFIAPFPAGKRHSASVIQYLYLLSMICNMRAKLTLKHKTLIISSVPANTLHLPRLENEIFKSKMRKTGHF
jgi:hypothetical protein